MEAPDMFATWLDFNSWLLEMAGKRILVDPWLVDTLVFSNQEWLFRGVKPRHLPVPDSIDLIVLSQGIQDHSHPPTLAMLDKSIRVVASINAAKVATKLGFTDVIALDHGDRYCLDDAVEIQAVPGAQLGPLVRENGYVLREQSSGLSLFYEPHGFHDPSLQDLAPIDIVVTPVFDVVLPLLGMLLRGQTGSVERAEWLSPKFVLPTAGTEEGRYEGLLALLLKSSGTPQTLQAELNRRGLSTQVLEPKVGQRLSLDPEPARV